jgi:uncharacterized protein
LRPFLIILSVIAIIACNNNAIYEKQQVKANESAETVEKSDTEQLPVFKYNPDALALGIIKRKKATCSVCDKERGYIYTGPFNSEEEVENICPWCIKDGSAAKKYDGRFQDEDGCDPVTKKEYVLELTMQTPGYDSWQEPHWPSHCGDFCAFKNYVGWKEIKGIKNELRHDLDKLGMTQQDIEKNFVNKGGMQGYLFQCLHCGKHRLLVDWD